MPRRTVRVDVGTNEVDTSRRSRDGRRTARLLVLVAALALVAGVGLLTHCSPPVNRLPAGPAATPVAGAATPIVYSPTPTPTPTGLVLTDAVWVVTRIGGEPFEPDGAKGSVFLEFSTARASVGDSCAVVDVPHARDGAALVFDLPTQRPEPCGSAVAAAQQRRFWTALGTVRQAERRGAELILRNAAGNVVLVAVDDLTDGAAPTTAAIPAGEVRVAIRNGTTMNFDTVRVVFPSGERVEYGPLAAGATSGSARVGTAYGYAWLEATSGQDSWSYRPIDYVGESPLGPGAHTYELVLVGDQLDIRVT